MAAKQKMTIVAVAGVVLAGSAAFAQVVTPPPAELRPVDADIPKTPRPGIRPPTPEEMRNAKPIEIKQRPAPTRPPVPPGVNVNALIEKDEAGNVRPLADHLHLAALKKNPMVDPSFLTQQAAYFAERRRSIEHVMLNNLDIMDRIDDGLFEKTDFNKRETIKDLVDAVKPLSHPAAPKSMTKDMEERQLLTPEQGVINEAMVRQYTMSVTQKFEKDMPDEARKQMAWQTMMALYKQNVDEFVHLSNALYDAAGKHAGEIAGKLNFTGSQAEALSAFAAAHSTSDAGARLSARQALRRALSLDQRREVLREAGKFVP
jgi:hypothetical protein